MAVERDVFPILQDTWIASQMKEIFLETAA